MKIWYVVNASLTASHNRKVLIFLAASILLGFAPLDVVFLLGGGSFGAIGRSSLLIRMIRNEKCQRHMAGRYSV